MESSTTPSGDPQEPGQGDGEPVDPAARPEGGDEPTPTETSQDVDGAEVSRTAEEQVGLTPGQDPANQVARTSAPLPERQAGAPEPDAPVDTPPAQSASTSTDRASVPATPEDDDADDGDQS